MKIKADFHIHTHHSPDSGSAASEIVARARELGFDVIGVTDHNTTKGALETRSIAKGNPLVLIGQEVKTASGEIIVFGPERDIPKDMGLADTCRTAKSAGGFIVVPHMFDFARKGAGKNIIPVIDMVDAVEVVNSRCYTGRANRKAAAFALEHGIPALSGSDSHFPEEIGFSFTELDIYGRLTESAVFDAIVGGRTSVHGGRSGFRQHLKTLLGRFGR